MIRFDGRKLTEVRPIRKANNLILSASSSIQLSFGTTTVLVAIFNSLVPEKGGKKINLEFDSFDQICYPEVINLCKLSTDIMIGEQLKFLIEYQLTINIFLIEDDGNLVIVLLNAISQGLKEIRVLRSKEIIFSGFGVGRPKKEIFFDPSKLELKLIQEELYYAIIFNSTTQELKFYQIMMSIKEGSQKITLDKKNIQKLILELGFYLFKIFN
jgi:ribonuclease PH|mmetsp:Transcript_56902/g.92083  ORF Transcript_56902/g.92083 Transcript_56902/m.92083 type:complete len:213 (-) Transcript_56902:511-1149(-)